MCQDVTALLRAEDEIERMEHEMAALRERDADLRAALRLAYRALTEGLADVPADRRDPSCAGLRVAAKREILRALRAAGDDI